MKLALKIALSVLVVALFLVTACFQKQNAETQPVDTAVPGKANPLTGNSILDQAAQERSSPLAGVITVTAKDWKFDPKIITVRKGEPVRLAVTAEDRTYNFELAEFHIKETVAAGEMVEIEFTPELQGTFIFFSRREWNGGKVDELGRLVVVRN